VTSVMPSKGVKILRKRVVGAEVVRWGRSPLTISSGNATDAWCHDAGMPVVHDGKGLAGLARCRCMNRIRTALSPRPALR
jgi:hypothetical protein